MKISTNLKKLVHTLTRGGQLLALRSAIDPSSEAQNFALEIFYPKKSEIFAKKWVPRPWLRPCHLHYYLDRLSLWFAPLVQSPIIGPLVSLLLKINFVDRRSSSNQPRRGWVNRQYLVSIHGNCLEMILWFGCNSQPPYLPTFRYTNASVPKPSMDTKNKSPWKYLA